jgi:hypothetical protein
LQLPRRGIAARLGTGGQDEDAFHALVIGLTDPVNNLGVSRRQERRCYNCMTLQWNGKRLDFTNLL